MTTTATLPVSAAQAARQTGLQPRHAVTFRRTVASEWIKLRSLRSAVWSFALIVLVSWGLTLLVSSASEADGSYLTAAEQVEYVFQAATFGVFFGQLVAAVLGVLVISGEYSTGMIRSTLTAVPTRTSVLVAKALVVGVTTFIVALIANFGAFLIAAPLLADQGMHADLFRDSVAAPLTIAALYLSVVAIFALGLGAIVRSSAGGIAAALGAILLLPIAVAMMPFDWTRDIASFLLMNAGMESFGLLVFGMPSGMESWQLILVTCAWAAVTLLVGVVLLKHRDG
ncbi:ABC transporter permease subunit [Homoserinimonas sp. OAct 916]|uniref:ABC transporter permease subunit n=1 Tax=Homoserinimonas sp. OAct 916 TaxID=2211450 RepID=UPI000DBE37A4|nr:ABC transporter permease subunit [Homoserinimonas sp. OAct 916]